MSTKREDLNHVKSTMRVIAARFMHNNPKLTVPETEADAIANLLYHAADRVEVIECSTRKSRILKSGGKEVKGDLIVNHSPNLFEPEHLFQTGAGTMVDAIKENDAINEANGKPTFGQWMRSDAADDALNPKKKAAKKNPDDPKNHVIRFQKQFLPKVLEGDKRQTVRNEWKRVPKVGDTLKVYINGYSKRTKLLTSLLVTDVRKIHISANRVRIEQSADKSRPGHILHEPAQLDDFARKDGFNDFNHLLNYFDKVCKAGLVAENKTFSGIIIYW